jgi:methionyl-tRNA synthetase
MDDALEIMPADIWRYYLMANAPESDDASFTWESFALTVHKDLADTLGNFVNRTLTFTVRHFDGAVPAGGELGEPERELSAMLERELVTYTELLERMEFRKAMQSLRSIWSAGNAYFDHKAPWATIRTDRDATAVTLRTAIGLIALCARLSAPVIPNTAERILNSLRVPNDARAWPAVPGLDTALEPGAPFDVPELLFRKVSDDDVATWRTRFGGAADEP